jgi:hypothetical protein
MEDRDWLGLVIEFEMPDGFDLGEIALDGGADGLEAVVGERVGLQG